ncbi:MAG: hypothetical protein ABI553_00555 [Chloroflexota bacterium]
MTGAGDEGTLQREVECPAIGEAGSRIGVRLTVAGGEQTSIADRQGGVLGHPADVRPTIERQRVRSPPVEVDGTDHLVVAEGDTCQRPVGCGIDRAMNAQVVGEIVGHEQRSAQNPGAPVKRPERQDVRHGVPGLRLRDGPVERPIEEMRHRCVGRREPAERDEVPFGDLPVVCGERGHLRELVEQVRLARVTLERAPEPTNDEQRDPKGDGKDAEGDRDPKVRRDRGRGLAFCDVLLGAGQPPVDASRPVGDGNAILARLVGEASERRLVSDSDGRDRRYRDPAAPVDACRLEGLEGGPDVRKVRRDVHDLAHGLALPGDRVIEPGQHHRRS